MPVDRSNYYHPSFLPLRDKIRERGAYSPFAYVQFQTQEGHGHHLMVGDGGDNLLAMGDSVEDIGEQLVAALAACSETKHKGHGRAHDPGQFRAAFAGAVDQLMSTPYDTDYLYQRWLEAMHRKWGGHIPAAVIMPLEDQWRLVVPNAMGDPEFFDVRPGVFDDMPMPDGDNSVEAPLGSYVKLTPEQREFRKMLRGKENGNAHT